MVPRGLRRVTSVTYQQAAANAEQLTLIVWPFSALLSKPSSATRYRIRQNIISSLFYCAYRGNWPSHGLIAKASVSRAIVGPGRVRSDIRLHLHPTLMRIRSNHAFPMREHIPFSLGNALPVSRSPAQENQSQARQMPNMTQNGRWGSAPPHLWPRAWFYQPSEGTCRYRRSSTRIYW